MPVESLLDFGCLVEVAILKQPPSDVKRGRLDFVLFCLLIVSSRRLASDSACTVHKHSCRCIRVSMYRCRTMELRGQGSSTQTFHAESPRAHGARTLVYDITLQISCCHQTSVHSCWGHYPADSVNAQFTSQLRTLRSRHSDLHRPWLCLLRLPLPRLSQTW